MKMLNRNYWIFLAICLFLLVYFYYVEYFLTINFYDTYYVVSYFYLVFPLIIIGSLVYLQKRLVKKFNKGIMKSDYSKLNTLKRNYFIFLTICLFLFVYLYTTGAFYLAYFNDSFQFIKYYYFILPLLFIGSIYYWLLARKLKD